MKKITISTLLFSLILSGCSSTKESNDKSGNNKETVSVSDAKPINFGKPETTYNTSEDNLVLVVYEIEKPRTGNPEEKIPERRPEEKDKSNPTKPVVDLNEDTGLNIIAYDLLTMEPTIIAPNNDSRARTYNYKSNALLDTRSQVLINMDTKESIDIPKLEGIEAERQYDFTASGDLLYSGASIKDFTSIIYKLSSKDLSVIGKESIPFTGSYNYAYEPFSHMLINLTVDNYSDDSIDENYTIIENGEFVTLKNFDKENFTSMNGFYSMYFSDGVAVAASNNHDKPECFSLDGNCEIQTKDFIRVKESSPSVTFSMLNRFGDNQYFVTSDGNETHTLRKLNTVDGTVTTLGSLPDGRIRFELQIKK